MRTQPQEVFEVKGRDGSVEGYTTTCACGVEMRAPSLPSLEFDAAKHLAWHRKLNPRWTVVR
jgi:hypothetical protein